jgi:glycosyltransferase involved in cell wall biosynthesis
MNVSVVLNTYNRAHLLVLALESWLVQDARDFEMLIADDGSTDATREVVERFRQRAPFDVRHVWHEHRGHRRAEILNRAIAASRGEWILFTDCDSLAFPNLVETHRRSALPHRLLCGGYFRLTEEETSQLTPEAVRSKRFLELFTEKRRREVRWKHLKATWEIVRRKPRRPHNMGLNYWVAREALVRINGYDEGFTGWGSADGNVRDRLRRIGVKPASLYATALVAHLWHPEEVTKRDSRKNREYASRKDISIYCERGLDSHVDERNPTSTTPSAQSGAETSPK